MPEAARKTHPHWCPIHSGGPILGGSPEVLLPGELGAACLLDVAACAGPDPIAQGSSTVLINGLPASQL